MIEIEESSGNVYADLQTPDAEAMYVKAQLASKIGDIVRHARRTRYPAARIITYFFRQKRCHRVRKDGALQRLVFTKNTVRMGFIEEEC